MNARKLAKWSGIVLATTFLIYFLLPDGTDHGRYEGLEFLQFLWWPLWIVGAVATVVLLFALAKNQGLRAPLAVALLVYAVLAGVLAASLIPAYMVLEAGQDRVCGGDRRSFAVYDAKGGPERGDAYCLTMANLISLPRNVVTFYGGPWFITYLFATASGEAW